jgi:flagellar motor component MotA
MDEKEFFQEWHKIFDRAMFSLGKARQEGLLALEELIDKDKLNHRDIMELGLCLVVDGTDPIIIDKILSNIINLEPDNDKRKLDIIKKEAVMGIQAGIDRRILMFILSSYINIEINEVMKYLEKFFPKNEGCLSDKEINELLKEVYLRGASSAVLNQTFE